MAPLGVGMSPAALQWSLKYLLSGLAHDAEGQMQALPPSTGLVLVERAMIKII
jgi:hypothetical protein